MCKNEACELFIPQSFHNLSSADVPGREGDADGDDHEEEEEDDEGDDEEVRHNYEWI